MAISSWAIRSSIAPTSASSTKISNATFVGGFRKYESEFWKHLFQEVLKIRCRDRSYAVAFMLDYEKDETVG